jgi:hypothetical protein
MRADDRLFIQGDELTDADYANLTLLEGEQIAYDKMSDSVLSKLALSGELYIATSSLVELDCRHSPLACETAAKVVGAKSADAHLQSIAFRILFETNPKQGLVAITNSIDSGDLKMTSAAARGLASSANLTNDPGTRAAARIVLQAVIGPERANLADIDEAVISALERAVT